MAAAGHTTRRSVPSSCCGGEGAAMPRMRPCCRRRRRHACVQDIPLRGCIGDERGDHVLRLPVLHVCPVLGQIRCQATTGGWPTEALPWEPLSGAYGSTRPQVLFFVKISSDIVGRTLPNAPRLVLRSGRLLLALASGKLIFTAAFFG